ncbi:MAG: MBL fold metallo-hydrolase [Clostridia bacterium]|nr:MBL fold metallo-hydrolase [Clostridia bacterium]
MNYSHKRKLFFIIVLVFFLISIFTACNDTNQEIQDNKDLTEDLPKFSVNFIDVDNGECILINTENGKCILIDTGLKSTYNVLKEKLSSLKITTIDYLILTNPSSEHVGAVEELLIDFTVNFSYIPKILDLSIFPSFSKALDTLNSKQIQTKISYINEYILIDGCKLAFLTPEKGLNDAYSQLNSEFSPSKYQIGNASPIIYFEYNLVRFLFTGDADKTQEKLVIENYKNNLYKNAFKYYGLELNLENIDFLKVSSGGDSNATSIEFLELINPKNAVISVSSRNPNCPSSSVISRLINGRDNYGLYRTDVHGTVSVYVDGEGKYLINTQKKV